MKILNQVNSDKNGVKSNNKITIINKESLLVKTDYSTNCSITSIESLTSIEINLDYSTNFKKIFKNKIISVIVSYFFLFILKKLF